MRLEKLVKDVRFASIYIIPALVLIIATSLWLAVVNPHPYIVFNRVSTPYPSIRLWPGVLIAACAAAVAGAIPFLRLRYRFILALSLAVLFFGVAVSVISILGLKSIAFPLISIYVSCIPSINFFVPAMAIASVIATCVCIKSWLDIGIHRWLKETNRVLKPKAGLNIWEGLAAWLSAFIILMIPYLPWINPSGTLVDVDHIYYIKWLNQTNWENLWQQLLSFNHGDRIAFLLPLYLVSRIIPPQTLDKLYIAGASALIPVLAESITRKLGITQWLGYLTSLLSSVPLYFIYGGYHANLAALVMTLATLNYRLRKTCLNRKEVIILALMSLTIAMTHSEAWILYVPFFLLDAFTLLAWFTPGIMWLIFRKVLVKFNYIAFAHNLFSTGSPATGGLLFQLNIILWGVPATWLTYVFCTASAINIVALKLLKGENVKNYLITVASTTLILTPIVLAKSSCYLIHRLIMNTLYWLLATYIMNRLWLSNFRQIIYMYIGFQAMYIIWLLVNALPAH